MTEREQLQLFVERAQQLRNTRLGRQGIAVNFSVNWNRVHGLLMQMHEPDEDDLRSFLLTFRQFIADKEPVYLNRVYNLCHQRLVSTELKGYLLQAREAWKQTLKHNGIKLVYNGRELTPEYVTDLWINGYYFHNDEDKAAALRRLVPHEGMLIRFHFMNFVIEATRQVCYVAHSVNYALKEDLFEF